MAGDTILLIDEDSVITQAQTHHMLSNHISSVLSMQKLHYDALSRITRASGMPEMERAYATWASSFNRHLSSSGDIHQGLGEFLTNTVDGFHTIDNSAPHA